MSLLDQLAEHIGGMSPAQKAELHKSVMASAVVGLSAKWIPTIGPQLEAFESEADELLYGGQAGGGKSGLIVGLALTQHKRSLLMRRQYGDLSALIDDALEKHGSRDGFNGSPPARLRANEDCVIDFAGALKPGDEQHQKGKPHDFLGIDEASQFLESQVRFLMGWVRSDDPGQRCRVVLATNPPEQPGQG
ncbi:MAG: terminase, partial [Planctomycetota bacterium]